jgi:beta-phosphoglucomutase-like phosphatase (HAD superfamily)
MERRALPELVIFDCHGVLVDSETIFARVLGACLSAAGFPATADEALGLGFGKNRESLTAAVKSRFRRALPENFFDVLPEACLVVEDSIAGVEAARAAGMPAVGFHGGSHWQAGHADRLRAAGCLRGFARMPDLAAYLVEKPCG